MQMKIMATKPAEKKLINLPFMSNLLPSIVCYLALAAAAADFATKHTHRL